MLWIAILGSLLQIYIHNNSVAILTTLLSMLSQSPSLQICQNMLRITHELVANNHSKVCCGAVSFKQTAIFFFVFKKGWGEDSCCPSPSARCCVSHQVLELRHCYPELPVVTVPFPRHLSCSLVAFLQWQSGFTADFRCAVWIQLFQQFKWVHPSLTLTHKCSGNVLFKAFHPWCFRNKGVNFH